MEKFAFAKLIAFIQMLKLSSNSKLEDNEIAEIDRLVMASLPEPKITGAMVEDVNELLICINDPTKFITAIKMYRVITGVGLKESKDAIEKYRYPVASAN